MSFIRRRLFRFIYPNPERTAGEEVWAELFADTEFENLILTSVFRARSQLNRYQRTRSKATDLRQQIEVYLEAGR